MIELSVIVPVYDEADVIDDFCVALTKVLSGMNVSYEVIFVDDGSSDGTFTRITDLSQKNKHISGIRFSRNFGHQMALFAGMCEAKGNYVLMMDGDMQHPSTMIPKLYDEIKQGHDMVCTVRKDRDIGIFKKLTAKLFYSLFSYLAEVDLKHNAADFRIISRKVCDEITKIDERDLFLRGMFSWIGFDQKQLEYEAEKRSKGNSKYSLSKMVRFSLSGITGFSVVPIRLSLIFCICSLGLGVLYSVYALYIKLILREAIQGWTSLIILMSLFFSGVFVMLGIIGEYIAKIHMESKKRPRYIVTEKINRN
ncbi:glycosyltransferase family 2 protein [Candidatus Omnitrophota bacterium]